MNTGNFNMVKKPINHSYLTAKQRSFLSFPVRWLFKNRLLRGRILDFGCGYGSDVKILVAKGLDVTGYDNYYFREKPLGKFNTVICSYVLNVLQPDEQPEVLMSVSEILYKDGIAYYAVRRDIRYEGFRIHKIHKKTTYQCNVKLPFKSLFSNEYCEIYEYRHYTTIQHDKSDCPFCCPNGELVFLSEMATVYAILDQYPVTEGHSLVIPKRHVSDYFKLSIKEQRACWIMVNRVKEILEYKYQSDGYNVGINVGMAGGQTISHVHIHLIPRYKNDVSDPTGGVRHVIPGRGNYVKRNK
jgi:diadenosine tetraphosphate (Ap4A) HIT family hydrolase